MDENVEAEKACTFCQRITKYTCLRYRKTACAICAPETSETEMDNNYKPQHQVGICRDCQTNTQALPLGGKESPIAGKRKQWTREQKLEFIALYKKYNNKSKAARELKMKYKHTINSRTYNDWITNEKKLRSATYGSKKTGCGRKAFYPDMEKRLYAEFTAMRDKGMKVKEWWFRSRTKQLMEEMYPKAEFTMSDSWFQNFKFRFRISLRRPTNTAQKPPESLRSLSQQFHRFVRRSAENTQVLFPNQTGLIGPWEQRDIANMDQTPLEFCFNTKGSTYSSTGGKTVWCRTTGSGHDKRQCTVQLTIFADGEPRIKPFIIFKGTGKRISAKETNQYDNRVVVKFQENAWCDEEMMIYWLRQMWNSFTLFSTQKRSRLLVIDEHRGQTTPKVKEILDKECRTVVALVPPGATSKLQPLDVAFNKEFKDAVDRLSTAHMSSNLDSFVAGEVTAGQRRVLFTKWVGQAWKETSAKLKETVVNVFVKCGIALPIDGSRDGEIHLDGIPDYEVGVSEDVEDVLFYDSDSEIEEV